jgi:hypothetical protein
MVETAGIIAGASAPFASDKAKVILSGKSVAPWAGAQPSANN